MHYWTIATRSAYTWHMGPERWKLSPDVRF